jgi:hypothetical protein
LDRGEDLVSESLIVAATLIVLLVILPAIIGFIFDRVRANQPKREALMNADNARARATLAYYNEVHDSHSG